MDDNKVVPVTCQARKFVSFNLNSKETVAFHSGPNEVLLVSVEDATSLELVDAHRAGLVVIGEAPPAAAKKKKPEVG